MDHVDVVDLGVLGHRPRLGDWIWPCAGVTMERDTTAQETTMPNAEHQRLMEHRNRRKHWRRWGPYVSDRQWGTIREDYSDDGDPWVYLTHDMAAGHAYRWGEDGLAGWSDNHQRLCFAVALWNERDPILKERLFGLSNPEGNHGEDVKECYWHLDGVPSHAYMHMLYRYPQGEFPYNDLAETNLRRSREQSEYELIDTGILAGNRFFDVRITYAKADENDTLVEIHITNAGPDSARIHVLPTLWFRNDWRWFPDAPVPTITRTHAHGVTAKHHSLGAYSMGFEEAPDVLFTHNETNPDRHGAPENAGLVKDGFHRFIVGGIQAAVGRDEGTKCAAHYVLELAPGEQRRIRARLHPGDDVPAHFDDFDGILETRRRETDAFYDALVPATLTPEHRILARRALAGSLWSKQWYYYVVEQWLDGDPAMPAPPKSRRDIRNGDWLHLYSDEVLSMPDAWEFPWFAVWDSAFEAVTFALMDADYAKRQIRIFTREWFMHPNGQLPAYEWDFDDLNPPVHAWAALRVYTMERLRTGTADTEFLESVFHKLLMNFTWWVNRTDPSGSNVFQGGFLGMDNIGVFDRTKLPFLEGRLEQSDGTSWMAMYCLDMLAIAWELADVNPAYEDIASKFFEHFLHIADAIHNIEKTGVSLWDDEDGFFYDQLNLADGYRTPLRIRSMVGLIPLLAVRILDYREIDRMAGFKRRMDWFFEHRQDLTQNIMCAFSAGEGRRCLLSLMRQSQLQRLLATMLDPNEFLSDYGIRSLSKAHGEHPFEFHHGNYGASVSYEPGESRSNLFGGNSNWRGPIWFPVNFLIIDALRHYHRFYGDSFQVECPTGSGVMMTLQQVADDIARRVIGIFEMRDGRRPALGDHEVYQHDPAWKDLVWFNEYFHGDTGAGLGASHQTGWTALLANMLIDQATEPTPELPH